MKKHFFLLLIIISQYYSVVAQKAVQNNNETLFNNIHQEKIFVHFNSTFLLTGETFYYKLYCLNSTNNKLSALSKTKSNIRVRIRSGRFFYPNLY